ncbi:MAG: glycosyltransferase family 2 protein [Opitutaceae bacterium]|nr:glycosyltransferase family 2 protein [Opitutaceae bacterium]
MKFTLFTPVFNRERVLERVWNSIRAQTLRDFEWIVVDDGSTDGSWAKLEAWRAGADFPMTVLRHEKNSGKHVAWNHAVAIARGELFVPCDSDDEFDADALEYFAREWSALSTAQRAGASGINVLCRDAATGAIVGTSFPGAPLWSHNLELTYRHRVAGEKWGCIRTELLRGRPFPVVPGYYPESYLWFSLARTHRVLCLNRALRTYHRDQGNQISSRVPRRERLPALFDYACWHIRENWDWVRRRPLRLVGEGSNVFLRARLLGLPAEAARARLRGAQAAAWWPLFALVGWLRFLRIKPMMTRQEMTG